MIDLTMEIQPLSEEVKTLAKTELRETPENVEKGLEELRELLANDPEIHFDTDEDFLLIFLRPCKFYAQSAYQLMRRIAEFKLRYKDQIGNLLPKDEAETIRNHNLINALQNRDQKGRRVLIQHCGSVWNPSQVSSEQIFRMLYLLNELAVIEPETQVRGGVVILDFEGLSTKQVMALTPAVLLKLMTYMQEALPVRIKEVHIVKQPFIFNLVWQILKNLIHEKLKKRTFFHGSKMSSLHKHLAPSHLPKNYGGDLPEIAHTGADWIPIFEQHMDHMLKMNACGFVNKNI